MLNLPNISTTRDALQVRGDRRPSFSSIEVVASVDGYPTIVVADTSGEKYVVPFPFSGLNRLL
jgi:hypothetical protein